MSDTLHMEMIQQALEEEKEKLQNQLQTFSGDVPTTDKNLDQMDIAQVYSDQGISHAMQMSERKQLAQVEVALQATQTRKTEEDFLQWLRKQEALKKQTAKDQRNPLKRPAPSRKS